MIDQANKKPNQRIWYVAPTYRQAKNIVWEDLKLLLEGKYIKKNDTDLTLTLKNGTTIELKGSENVDALRGTRIDLIIFDEVAFMINWDIIWKALRPVLADSKGDAWFISTPNGFNHFKDLYEMEKTDKAYKSFSFTSFDNPFLDASEIEDMRKEMSAEAFAQEVMAEFVKMAGIIYKDYSLDVHIGVLPELDTGEFTFIRSVDFGFRHKTAVLWGALSDRHLYIYDALYVNQMRTKDLAETIRLKDRTRKITYAWGDSAQPQILADLDSYGVHFEPVKKGADSVVNGIQLVSKYLKYDANSEPILRIDKGLTNIAHREFVNYHWVEAKTGGVPQEKPYKVNDDFLDALRYMIMGIEDVKLMRNQEKGFLPSWFKSKRNYNKATIPLWAFKKRGWNTQEKESEAVWED